MILPAMTTHPVRVEDSGSEFDFARTLAAARTGDAAATEALTKHFYPRVEAMVHIELARDLRHNRPWLATRFSTGDVVQDVFRGLLKDLNGFEGDSENGFVGYLAMMIRNRLLDALRFHQAARRDGRRSTPWPQDMDPRLQGAGPATRAGQREGVDQFIEALQDFSTQDQLLLRERLENSTSFQELAAKLGYTSKWAASRAFYAAQAKLVIRLRQNGGGTQA
ncbi:MAG: RNA polymerase sigma factor (sigma-70 family) [Planctomycetota bacterium]|jgi:RNA polymerase sigma factor (sigma-70 family)